MSKKYIEISDAYYDFDSKYYEIILNLVDGNSTEENPSKKIYIPKKIWYLKWNKKFGNNFFEDANKKEKFENEIKNWLENFAKSLKDEYENNWDMQRDERKVGSNEINIK